MDNWNNYSDCITSFIFLRINMKQFLTELIVWVTISLLFTHIFRMYGVSEYNVGMFSTAIAVIFDRILFNETW